MPEGHGEKIWVWAHRRTEQTIYTLRDRLNDHHDLKQIPFNGKKLKPSSLRKDYWYPMAWINFNAGHGAIGRHVFQQLRELKHLHEVSWPDTLRHKTPNEYTDADREAIANAAKKGQKHIPLRSKQQRGKALNAQKKNSIADMAAVLGGIQKTCKIHLNQFEEGGQGLAPVSIRWANNLDRNYAKSWTDNVRHEVVEGDAIAQLMPDGTTLRTPATPGTTATTAPKGPARGERELNAST